VANGLDVAYFEQLCHERFTVLEYFFAVPFTSAAEIRQIKFNFEMMKRSQI
jgi:hypothetical protein